VDDDGLGLLGRGVAGGVEDGDDHGAAAIGDWHCQVLVPAAIGLGAGTCWQASICALSIGENESQFCVASFIGGQKGTFMSHHWERTARERSDWRTNRTMKRATIEAGFVGEQRLWPWLLGVACRSWSTRGCSKGGARPAISLVVGEGFRGLRVPQITRGITTADVSPGATSAETPKLQTPADPGWRLGDLPPETFPVSPARLTTPLLALAPNVCGPTCHSQGQRLKAPLTQTHLAGFALVLGFGHLVP